MKTSHQARIRVYGLLGVLVGVVFILYAVTKGPLTAAIVAEGWRLPGLSPTLSALLVHLVEEVPLVIMAGLFVGLGAHLDVRSSVARAGMTVALAGVGFTIVSHLAEHLLAPVTLPALFGDTHLLIWSYYLSWAVLYTGLSVYGLALLRDAAVPTWLAVVFVALLPGVFVGGMTVVVFDLFTFAGTLRLALGVTSIVVGTWAFTAKWTTAPRHAEHVNPQD